MPGPIVIRVIGMPGAGKTLVARMAARAFAERGMKTARLDVDRYAQQFVVTTNHQKFTDQASFVQAVLKAFAFVKRRFVATQPGHRVSVDDRAIQAVKVWMGEQKADVIFLELRWLSSLFCYRGFETWLVTASPDEVLERLTRNKAKHKLSTWEPVMMQRQNQDRWASESHLIPTSAHVISNAGTGRPGILAIRQRLDALVRDIILSRAEGAYDWDEDDRPTIPPATI